MQRFIFLFLALFAGSLLSHEGVAQGRERGLFKKNLSIKPKNSDSKKKDDDFQLDEEPTPQLKVNNQFEPTKAPNPVVASPADTTTINKGETLPVEVDEEVQVGDDFVKVASYFSVWDSRVIDPYGIDAKDFDGVIDIQLYDPPKNRLWAAPLTEGKITSVFGPRWGRWHSGVDLDLETGDPVYAAFDGIVRVVAFDGGGYGRFIVVRHYNGLETLYGHLSSQSVESGQLVKAGDLIGLGGSTGRSTGSHLHFEVRYEGNPFTPLEIYSFPTNTIKSEHYLLTARVWDYLRGGSRMEYSSGEKRRTRKTYWYRVRSGDTLGEIAAKTGVSVSHLKRLNRVSSNRLPVGKRLRIK
jgi:murein DD-endopeptidase MepM/ murein hydrolase activator NlpD